MNRFSLFFMILCATWLSGCDREKDGDRTVRENETVSLMDGSIIISNRPDVNVTSLNEFPEAAATAESTGSSGLKRAGAEDTPASDLRGNDYLFKLVAKVGTFKISGVEVQATHVKITDNGYAFVSYNEKGEPHRGGVVVFKYTVQDGSLEDVTVEVTPNESCMLLNNAEISAIDYYNGKLYMTGANSDPGLGYSYSKNGQDYAFFMVMELDNDMKFKKIDPKAIVQLTSFQGTSIRVHNDRVYVTTGDGIDGGLYIFNATDYSRENSILGLDHARSVDVDANNIFLMQAQHARITKYDLDGKNEKLIYDAANESMQKDAKSEILAWDKYLFVSENESGLRMLSKENGEVNESLDRPGEDPENEVTNSVTMNCDLKKNYNGEDVQSNLLLLANGGKGIYWYDVMKDDTGKDRIVSCKDNSILGGDESANFIATKGNIVFVADGLGGLKVLYIGLNSGNSPPPVSYTCDNFMPYLYSGKNALLPENQNVFGAKAPQIIKTLFSSPDNALNYIEIKNKTKLYISYLGEWAGWNNSMGYFTIPSSVERTPEAEYAYYIQNVKPRMYTTAKNGRYVLKDEYIIFKNIKDASKGGSLKAPNTYQVGNKEFNAGDRVVLFMAPNGWSSQNNRVEISFNGTYQLFFTHKGLNKNTNSYARVFGNFKGVQHNTYYSDDCNSIVLFIEDNHNEGTDTDFNDIIFAISDNIENKPVLNLALPRYSIKAPDGIPTVEELIP